MSVDNDFEADFLKQRLTELHRTHAGEATLIDAILDTLDYQKTAVHAEFQVRGMVIALGYTLSQKGAAGLPGLEAWLGQFVKDGALSAEQAAAFIAQAQAIYA
jgi:hypothetical protein